MQKSSGGKSAQRDLVSDRNGSDIINNKPERLLSLVFPYCIPTLGLEPSTLSERSAPLNIGSVCRRWRKNVLNNAALWSSFEIRAKKNTLEWLPALKLWLKRSGDSPLSFRIEFIYHHLDWDHLDDEENFDLDAFEDMDNSGAFYRCWKEIQAHQQRWKDVEITVKGMMETQACILSVKNAPLLENLNIFFHQLNQESPVTSINLATCPRLRTLKLRGAVKFALRGAILNDLRELDIFRTDRASEISSVPDFHAFLRAAPNLETAKAVLVGYDPGAELAALRLEHLHTLHVDIRTVEPSSKSKLFGSLTLPQLRSLRAQIGKSGRTGENNEDVLALIERAGGRVVDLELDGKGMRESEVKGCIRACPLLERLLLGTDLISSSLTKDLSSIDADGEFMFCPLLRTLEVSARIGSEPSARWQAALEDLAVARWRGNRDGRRTFASVKLSIFEKIANPRPELQKCVSEGLQVKIEKPE